MPVKIDHNGAEQFSELDSFLAWREATSGFSTIKARTGEYFPSKTKFIEHHSVDDKGDVCGFCRTGKILSRKAHDDVIYCMCYLLGKIREQDNLIGRLRTPTRPHGLNQLEIWGNNKVGQGSLTAAIQLAREFIINPYQWLVLNGITGCGKSHILESIANAFGPFAFYISAETFEHAVFEAMDDNTLTEMMHSLATVPVLLYDDWGTEHGGELVTSKLRQIITYRYQRWPEYPVAVTTNMNVASMYQADQRVASRLLEEGKSTMHSISIGDYRIRGIK
jgi:DNA replication protein DnaC